MVTHQIRVKSEYKERLESVISKIPISPSHYSGTKEYIGNGYYAYLCRYYINVDVQYQIEELTDLLRCIVGNRWCIIEHFGCHKKYDEAFSSLDIYKALNT